MFTPLTFSCAPDLLRPMQGQKVRLISFIKKTVAANLAAEKLEPPDCPAHIARMLDRERPVGAPTNTMDEDRGWLAVHRRAQSAVPAHMEGGRPVAARTESAPMYAPPQHVQNQPQHVQAQRPLRRMGRRRASSAGEGAFSAENAFVAGNAKRDNRTSVEDQNVPPAFSKPQPPLPIPPPSKHVMPPPSKHIMPRAELCDLLENMESTLVHVHEPRSQGLRPPPHRPVLRGARTNRL
ncbi:hypothetical protein PLICRDRAFT_35819 [Plicaturopsis crispa FD-325 SS-3]|nr:hypothetical protein PLICRDRAFT_35819 [Plicaturopsis crispa FD-325 SS-3]